MTVVSASSAIVQAYCKVCKGLVEHTVTELKGNKPGRVQCRTCEDTHPFRAAAPKPRKKATKVAAVKSPTGHVYTYDELVEGRDLSQTTKYTMAGAFEDAELINHDTFGVGMVVRVLADRKIEVMFPDGARTLVHAR